MRGGKDCLTLTADCNVNGHTERQPPIHSNPGPGLGSDASQTRAGGELVEFFTNLEMSFCLTHSLVN